MKKLLTTALTAILALGMCLGFVGCAENGGIFFKTASHDCEEPIYACDENIHKWGSGVEMEENDNVGNVIIYTCELCGKTAKEYVDATNDGVIYRISSGNTVEVCAYIGESPYVKIESSYRGYPVTRIGAEAFRGSSITGIILPDGLLEIGERAFSECYRLSHIKIPETVNFIDDYAFLDCSRLAKIEIPANVSIVGDGAFRCCSELTSVAFFSDTTTLGKYVFDDCRKLEGLTLPEKLPSLREQLFCECESLTYIKIPDSVTYIGQSVFVWCKNLQTVVIGSGVQVIDSNVFGGCESLENVYYNGTSADWAKISKNSSENPTLLNATVYFYSSDSPTQTGNYWHYDEDGIPVKW